IVAEPATVPHNEEARQGGGNHEWLLHGSGSSFRSCSKDREAPKLGEIAGRCGYRIATIFAR
ncbi:MAG TPA: hypothetical protein VN710_06785, partial [Verrucomicrobiae bacterium]|nr:hypothetical protein [Verrucomicrobiae bacterium]